MTTEAREIAYSRDGYEPSVGVCPMCGVETTCGLACDTCFRAHRNDASKPPYGDVPSVVAIRDWFYRRGVELRAAGKMPALKGKACSECGASPCDCGSPDTWCYYWRWTGSESRLNSPLGYQHLKYGNRAAAIVSRNRVARMGGVEVGPVQRITDPPYSFDEPDPKSSLAACGCPADSPTCRHWTVWRTGGNAPAVQCSSAFGETLNFANAEKGAASFQATWKQYQYVTRCEGTDLPGSIVPVSVGAIPCGCTWCDRTATAPSAFCSTNCESAHEDRIAATTKRDAYCAGKRGIDALRGEVEWAERKTDEEIETVRRRWRALRHRAIEGNEAVWPVLKEEEASW